ncbi:MAG TPA: hypothetical protein VFW64_10195 [Pseudonocardiaceae bacterium]|nr:hypothetical protein [Pseudonocardiaceae bacterium]
MCLVAAVPEVIVDLRTHPYHAVIDRVERCLGVCMDRKAAVVKRRSVGARTDRNSWIRIEARPFSKLTGQGSGVEGTACLPRVIAKPEWYQGLSWQAPEQCVLWRADETELVTAFPVNPGGVLRTDPELGQVWWERLGTSLGALAAQTTTRVATPNTAPISQERVTATIERVFADGVESTVAEWVPAHADLAWANLTAPECWLLDWEDWGLAPRGWDAATLWCSSLAVPGLAERVQREYQADLASRSGLVSQLYFCAEMIAAGDCYAGPLAEPSRREAPRLISALRP